MQIARSPERLRRVLGDAVAAEVLVFAGEGGFERAGAKITDPPGLAVILADLDGQAA